MVMERMEQKVERNSGKTRARQDLVVSTEGPAPSVGPRSGTFKVTGNWS